MACEVILVDAGQQLPGYWDACIFIGGSSPDANSSGTSWQLEVISWLRERWTSDGRLVVLVAKPGLGGGDNTSELIEWYDHAFRIADVMAFWWLGDTDAHFMSVTLAAWGDSRRLVCGVSSHGPQVDYLLHYADDHAISTATTLVGLADAALDKIGSGARRTAGECEVPLTVWRAKSFQRWYSAQTSAGNKLLGARQVWTFNTGPPKRFLLYWALHVQVYVQAERRIKSNEVVISRPDISVLALYQRGATIDDTCIVLVREFRSPASTADGFVHELPGGSGVLEDSALDQAVRETAEETGLAIDAQRIRAHGSRQLAGTMSAHHAHLFAAEITDAELAQLRHSWWTSHGVTQDTEQTWTEIATFGELRESGLVDWATLGMIASVVLDATRSSVSLIRADPS